MQLSNLVRHAVAASAVAGWLAVGSARADITTQYSFENDLLDTAPAGTAADNLSAVAASGALSTSYAPGIVGQAVRVSRDAGEATVLFAPDSNDLDLTSSWTVEAFIKPDLFNTGPWDRLATKWFDGGNQWHWTLRLANNGQDLFMNGAQVINAGTTGTVPLDEWSHVAFTGDPTTGIQLWQDGQEVGSAAYAAVNPGADVFRIGNSSEAAEQAAFQFSGLVDEFLIHNTAQGSTYMESRAALLSAPPDEMTAPPPTSGLVSYYTFDNTLEDVASDHLHNVGTVEDDLSPRDGDAVYAAGRVGNAVSIGNGVGDAVDLVGALSADVQLPATYTIEAWINPSELTGSWQRLILNWGGTAPERAYHFAIRNNSGFNNGVSLFHAQSNGAEPNANGGTVVANQWQHVAAVADGTNLTVYLDGEAVAATPYDGTINTTATEGLGVGDSNSARSTTTYNGLLDDLAMWSVPLTPEQIRYQYQQGLQGGGALVPEPASGLLAGLAAVALGFVGARRRRANRTTSAPAGRR